ncbi:MAG: hypothetical protein LBG71_06660 [Clostridiales Family XIII bacterium]|nr:hypothetical protein [Clostridiales Family XIII bacterium]
MRVSYKLRFYASLVFALVFLAACMADATDGREKVPVAGYRAVVFGEDAFVAVGDEGRIDRLLPDAVEAERLKSPVSSRLNAVSYAGGRYFCVGDGGVVALSSGRELNFVAVDTGVKKEDLLSVAGIKGYVFAGGKNGQLLRSKDGDDWEIVPNGFTTDIISMASNGARLFAITREGQIYTTTDGQNVTVRDYNAELKGDNPTTYSFGGISSLGGMFVITGAADDADATPVIMTSGTGEEWSPRSIQEIDKKPLEAALPLKIGGMALLKSEMVSPANGTKLLTVAECSACNTLNKTTDFNILSMAYNAETLLLVGEGYRFKFL